MAEDDGLMAEDDGLLADDDDGATKMMVDEGCAPNAN